MHSLDIAPESQDPQLAYQWFRFRWPDSNRDGGDRLDYSLDSRSFGWEPVWREKMPTEFSDNTAWIERGSMRLYSRSRAEVDAAAGRLLGKAADQKRIVDGLSGAARWRPGVGFPEIPTVPSGRPVALPAPQGRPMLWRLRHPRGGPLIIIHEERCRPWIAGAVRICQYRLARLRIVYLSREETQIADYMQSDDNSFAEWAGAKLDLICKGEIPMVRPVRYIRVTVRIDLKPTEWTRRGWRAIRSRLRPRA